LHRTVYQIMAGRTMNARLLLPLTILLATAGCGGSEQPVASPPLAGARIGAPFALTDQNGRTVRDSDFAGKYRIMYFGYTYCPDVCPVDVRNIGAGLKAFEERDPASAAKVVPIFVTVDPARDTPPVLKQFVSAFHPRMVGLTGSAADIAAVAKGYGIFFEKGKAAPGGGYMVDHTRQAYLMGPDGAPIALLPAEQGGDAVAAELARWIR